MILCHFDRLRREKASRENRDLSVLTVSAETGLSYNTLQRLRRERLTRIQLSTIEILCRYFTVGTLCELLEYNVDSKAEIARETPDEIMALFSAYPGRTPSPRGDFVLLFSFSPGKISVE